MVAGVINPVPKEDRTVFTLKSSYDGASYKVVLPWIAMSRDECMSEVDTFLHHSNSSRRPSQSSAYIRNSKRSKTSPLSYGSHPYMNEFKAQFDSSSTAFELFNTSDPVINFGIYSPEDANLGIIIISSFVPANNDVLIYNSGNGCCENH
jgi:hypothetical protein